MKSWTGDGFVCDCWELLGWLCGLVADERESGGRNKLNYLCILEREKIIYKQNRVRNKESGVDMCQQ